MPVRVSCPSCGKVLNAPSASRGKAVKCPDCQAKVPVPVDDAAESTEQKPAAKTGKQATVAKSSGKKGGKSKSGEGLFSESGTIDSFDLDNVEDKNSRICPKCGTEVTDEESDECPSCGVDITTGQLPERKRRRLNKKGPDPADFYLDLSSDAWTFIKKNRALAIRTGTYTFIWIYLLLPPALAMVDYCTNLPPKSFWAFVSTLFVLATLGWVWFLTTQVVKITIDKQNYIKRLNLDTFLCIALGVKAVMWLMLYFLPAHLIGAVLFLVTGRNPLIAGIGAGVVLLLLLPSAPGSMIHFCMPVEWRGWCLWKTMPAFFRTIGQQMYWWVLLVGTGLPVLLVAAGLGAMAYFLGPKMALGIGVVSADRLASVLGGVKPEPFSAVIAWLLLSVIAMYGWGLQVMVGFWQLFSMRTLGQMAFYCREPLELQAQTKEGKYVAKEIRLGPDGRPIQSTPISQYVTAGLAGTVVLYMVANVILYFATAGKFMLLPKFMKDAFVGPG